jgi:hypothetical protein
MKKIVLILLPLMLSGVIFAQTAKRKSENRVNISYTPQWYLHSLGSVNHYGDDYGQQVIYPHNAFGQAFEIEYQHTTRYGLIMSTGLQAGIEKHDIDIHYNFSYVDPAPEFKNTWEDMQYNVMVKYVALRFMAGYQWKFPFKALPGWDIEAKAGVALRHYTTYEGSTYNIILHYEKNDTFFSKKVSYNTAGFGSSQKSLLKFSTALNFHIGVTRNINLGFVRTLSIGIDGTYGLRKYSDNGSSGSAHIEMSPLDNYAGALLSYSQTDYSSPDFALGIKFAVGLWPKSRSIN